MATHGNIKSHTGIGILRHRLKESLNLFTVNCLKEIRKYFVKYVACFILSIFSKFEEFDRFYLNPFLNSSNSIVDCYCKRNTLSCFFYLFSLLLEQWDEAIRNIRGRRLFAHQSMYLWNI